MRPLPFAILAVLLAGAALLLRKDTAAPSPGGFLGLEFAPVTRAAAARAPLLTTRAALIVQVTPDSPAARAGVKQGEILAQIDGAPVLSAREAARTMAAHKAGDHVVLTLINIPRGEIYPHHETLVFAAAPPVTRNLSVLPPRLLAREYYYPSSMAANAAWSRRMRGAINPLALVMLRAGTCSAAAPEDWKIVEVRENVFHVAKEGSRAIYKVVLLPAGRDPRAFALELLGAIFRVPLQAAPSQEQDYGFRLFDFGTEKGTAGFVVYRMTASRHLSLWIAAVPATDIADLEPIAAGAAFSIRCAFRLAPPALPYDAKLASTAISVRCREGRCEDSDFAATILARYRKGYVHNAQGDVFLINPRRDLWATGPEGPGFYRQTGGEVERLEPGLTAP